jgi:hypothetical protein
MPPSPRRSKASAGPKFTETELRDLLECAGDSSRSDQERDVALLLIAGTEPFQRLHLQRATLSRLVACGKPSVVLAFAQYCWDRRKYGWDDRNEDWLTLPVGRSILDRAEARGLADTAKEVWETERPGQRLYRPIAD